MENYIKDNALCDVINKFNETVDDECEFVLDDEQLNDIYGPRHASNPAKFKFELGDKKMIRQLASHVKGIVDENGKLKGLGHFEMKKKKKDTKQLISITKQKRPNPKASNCQESIEMLHSKLYARIQNYLKELNVDFTDFNKDMVTVEPNRIFGAVNCILCTSEMKKSSSKRVYYHFGSRSSFWTISNFKAHIESVHTSNIKKFPVKEKKTDVKKKRNGKLKSEKVTKHKNKMYESDTPTANLNSNSKPNKSSCNETFDESLEMVVIENDTENDMLMDENILSFAEQFFNQINKMVGYVLINGEGQQQMNFQLKNNTVRSLSVVCTIGDGNCLFSALTHQLFGDPIDSTEHVNKSKNLRAAVVAHILVPENFPSYQYNLQDRVFELKKKKKSQFEDLEQECKIYVREVLSKSGEWGGPETIRAVSNMYKTNIAVFEEDGACCIFKSQEKNFNRTIMIAYRYALNEYNERVYNHYDSITDMDPDDILTSANSLSNK